MPQKIQATVFLGKREMMSTPIAGHTRDNRSELTRRTGAGLSGGIKTSGVRKSNSRLDATSAAQSAHRDQASRATARGLVPEVLTASACPAGIASVKFGSIWAPIFDDRKKRREKDNYTELSTAVIISLLQSLYQNTRWRPDRASS